MNIVVLDGYTLNPGDLSWAPLEQLGSLTVYDRTRRDQLLERAQGADVLFTNKTSLDAAAISELPNLRYIGVLATGYNVVDTAAASERGIVVTNVPDYSTASVVQLVFAYLLEHCHHVQRHSDEAQGGRWSASADFMFASYPLIELAGKTIGIVGFGQIGQQVARAALAFGMQVLVHSRTAKQVPGLEQIPFVSLEELLERSDFITLHCPLTPLTEGLVNKAAIARMKPSAFFINTARGGHVVEADLAEALNAGTIAGAALDVLAVEPPKPDNPLLTARNCIITPHIGWATLEARERLMGIAVQNLTQYLAGETVNQVNE
ncbi:D-isomer specific 2-hydroxyacid dehydrogenase NAD-binding [Paenibacillus curdlanolyticus YK9]|uniref:D-isomer specific 2-hydroxyacid dehydrogenase NAD-binding n=1 Tax=Paenibacillus curdlanolyticus YK9 TaxID=717606 RepID=E0IDV5_9BACL|nr:D-2-hydroxyacid dehydrogenase [Paenibacillus curdlanolyticus]EFM09309.1 D-isomer specific 2-hydroxyacid dehydrogenase NAD-binding [Paenibacillus curdlanolyticus YK9]